MRICIVGLLDKQAACLIAKFKKMFHSMEFVFVTAEKAAKGRLNGAYDRVILMTKFISHSIQGNAIHYKPILLHGGASLLITYLLANQGV
jgi:hypothetical protein